MLELIKKYSTIILIFVLLAIAIFVYLFSLRPGTKTSNQNTTILPTVVPQSSFLITATVPANNAVGVFPGEIEVSFTSNVPIESLNDYSIFFSPQLIAKPKLISTFPTQQVKYQILGGLNKSTEYTVVVKNKHSENVAIWSFTTSGQQPQSSTGFVNEEQKKINQKYYPLFDLVPFSNEDFSIDYSGRLTLIVKIKKNNTEAIKKEVLTWIAQHGVNPSTHTINYQNAF
jgi:hypothetical protein